MTINELLNERINKAFLDGNEGVRRALVEVKEDLGRQEPRYLSREALERLMDVYPGLARKDGYDDCILGVVDRCGLEPFLLYDKEAVLAKLGETEGLTYEEASEFHDYNQAWVGDATPGFLEAGSGRTKL